MPWFGTASTVGRILWAVDVWVSQRDQLCARREIYFPLTKSDLATTWPRQVHHQSHQPQIQSTAPSPPFPPSSLSFTGVAPGLDCRGMERARCERPTAWFPSLDLKPAISRIRDWKRIASNQHGKKKTKKTNPHFKAYFCCYRQQEPFKPAAKFKLHLSDQYSRAHYRRWMSDSYIHLFIHALIKWSKIWPN